MIRHRQYEIDDNEVKRLLGKSDEDDALNRIMEIYEPFIILWARKFSRFHDESFREDLAQDARLILISIVREKRANHDHPGRSIAASIKWHVRTRSYEGVMPHPYYVRYRSDVYEKAIERLERFSPYYASLIKRLSGDALSLETPIIMGGDEKISSKIADHSYYDPYNSLVAEEVMSQIRNSFTSKEMSVIDALITGEHENDAMEIGKMDRASLHDLMERVKAILGEDVASPFSVHNAARIYSSVHNSVRAGRRESSLEDAFFHRIKRTDEHWIWTGDIQNKGGGYLNLKRGKTRKRLSARRMSYELNVGQIEPGAQVIVSCREYRCVRPDHLAIRRRARGGDGE